MEARALHVNGRYTSMDASHVNRAFFVFTVCL